MNYLLKQVEIADPRSSYFKKIVDILIEKGKIKRIAERINNSKTIDKTIDLKNATIFPGFCDLNANFCDPGYEHREDILSGSKVAAAGGYTGVVTTPNCNPVIQSKSQVEYLLNKAEKTAIDIYPLGAITEQLDSEKPTEIYDMQKAGAVGFTNYPFSIQNSGVLARALQYTSSFNGVIIEQPCDYGIFSEGQINEGEYSVRLGLKGIPVDAETIAIKKALNTLEYTRGRLHLSGISTKEGVRLIAKAKKEGLNITADVFSHHLIFTEENTKDYNTLYKTMPPLRTEKDRKALIKGLLDETIDCVSSQHTPIETEKKRLEFEYANFGLLSLQTSFSLLYQALKFTKDKALLAKLLSINPRKIIGQQTAIIEKNAIANFSIISLKQNWTFTKDNNLSKSENSPLFDRKFKGKVRGVFNKGKIYLND